MTCKTERLYVRRDEEGRIAEVSLQPREGFELCLALSEPDPTAENRGMAGQINELIASDLALVRVTEDLIDLLISKEVIRFTDLPQVAQQKLLDRRSIRTQLRGLDLLGDEGDEIL